MEEKVIVVGRRKKPSSVLILAAAAIYITLLLPLSNGGIKSGSDFIVTLLWAGFGTIPLLVYLKGLSKAKNVPVVTVTDNRIVGTAESGYAEIPLVLLVAVDKLQPNAHVR